MLILTRRLGETVKIGDNIEVTIVSISHGQVRLAIKAPREISVDRSEIRERKDAERVRA